MHAGDEDGSGDFKARELSKVKVLLHFRLLQNGLNSFPPIHMLNGLNCHAEPCLVQWLKQSSILFAGWLPPLFAS
jgi:hypothetical protein